MKENSNQSFQFAQPQPAAKPVELGPLLDEIKSTIQAHVVIPDQAATALAVWAVHTYVYKERDAVAYVAIDSPENAAAKPPSSRSWPDSHPGVWSLPISPQAPCSRPSTNTGQRS